MRSIVILFKTKFQHLSYPLLWVTAIIEKNDKGENLKDNNTLRDKISAFFGPECKQECQAISGAVVEGPLGSGSIKRQRPLIFNSHGVTGSKGAKQVGIRTEIIV